MKIFFLLLFSLLFCANANGMSKEERIAFRLIGKFSKQMWEKRGLQRGGTGVSGPENKINTLDIYFETEQALTMNSARRLIIETAHDFLDTVNGKLELRQYLSVYPYTYKGISLIIRSRSANKEAKPFVRSVFLTEKGICFANDEIKVPDFGMFHRETYEEAIAILQNEDLERAEASSVN